MDPTAATHQLLPNEDNKSSSTTMCRQTTTRWTPTTEQIRILKELYYNNGLRSPSADQIQKISARLRQYGKIEGKNVFYWFQNHKARERQKKRLISTDQTMHHRTAAAAAVWRSPAEDVFYNKCPNFTSPPGAPSAPGSSAGMIHADGQFGKYGYGSLSVENGFWDGGHNLAWTGGVDPYNQHPSAYNFLDKNNYFYDDNTTLGEDQEADGSGLMETLPLFPIHGEEEVSGSFCNMKQESGGGNYNNNNYNNWYMQAADGGGNMSCSRASLELTLNSYGYMSPFSP